MKKITLLIWNRMTRSQIFNLKILISVAFITSICFTACFLVFNNTSHKQTNILDSRSALSFEPVPKLSQNNDNYSHYELSVIMDEVNSFVEGNLTVKFYNNDLINLSQIPFHLYLSGMKYQTRPGVIEIINITDKDNPSLALDFEVFSDQQIMWVNLTNDLEPENYAEFIIKFNATLPDGPYDRANSHGADILNARIYKFTGFYPIACVYDNEDGWNIDPYLHVGDPFYFDMAYYDFYIEVPDAMLLAVSGALQDKEHLGSTIRYHYNTSYPVREVTFSASRYFQVESKLVNGVNVSIFYLFKSSSIWSSNGLKYAEQALLLFNETFGKYPYYSLNLVEEYTEYGGMEYPTQVYCTEAIDGWGGDLSYRLWWFELIVVHEISHQWWYNLIGNDEVDIGFLDEGFAEWSTGYYGESYYGSWEYFQTLDYSYHQLAPYIERVRMYYHNELLQSKINQSTYEFISSNTDYYFASYRKAPLILEKLRQTIGHLNFIEGVRLYFETWKFKHATLKDLQDIFEFVNKSSLAWFFLPWYNNPYLPAYRFSNNYDYNADNGTLSLTIRDVSEPANKYPYSQQVPLEIYNTNNQKFYSELIWINSTTTIRIELSQIPKIARLSYNNYVLVQLDNPSKLYLDLILTNIGTTILGFELGILTLSSIMSMGLIIYLTRRKLRVAIK